MSFVSIQNLNLHKIFFLISIAKPDVSANVLLFTTNEEASNFQSKVKSRLLELVEN